MQDNTAIQEQQRDPLKDLYNEFNPSLKLANTFDEFKTVMKDPSARKDFYTEFNPKLNLANSFKEFDEVLGMKPIKEEPPKKIPSFKEFALANNIPLKEQRAIAEGTKGVELQKLVEKDIERKDIEFTKKFSYISEDKKQKRRDEALDRTTENSLKTKGVSYVPGDVIFKKLREKIEKDVDEGNLALTVDNQNKPVYKRKLGFWESAIDTVNETIIDDKESKVFLNADNKERVRLADEYLNRESQSVKNKAAEILGGAILPVTEAAIGGMAGTAIFPGAGTVAGVVGSILGMSETAYNTGFKNSTIQRYKQDVDDILRRKGTITEDEKVKAMERATTQGVVGGLGGVAFAAGLSVIPVGSSFAGRGLISAVKNAAKHTAYDAGRQALLGSTIEQVKETSATLAGYNTDLSDNIESVIAGGVSGAETALAFGIIHQAAKVPKYLSSAADNYLSTLPRPELNNLSKDLEGRGIVETGFTEKLNTRLDRFEEAKKQFEGIVPEEDMGVFTGLAIKKQNLEEQIKSTTLAPIREKLQQEVNAIENRINEMLKSKEPVKLEVDDITGDTGDGEPLTEPKIIESVKLLETEPISDIESKKADIEKRRKEELDSVIQTVPIEVLDQQGNIVATSDRKVAINAKYDAELAKLETEKTSEKIEEPVKEEKAYSGSYIKKLQEKELLSKIDKMDEPSDARGIAMRILSYSKRKISQESFGKEVARGKERFGSAFVDKGGKGVSVERMAEDAWFELPEYLQATIEPQDIRNEILDLVGSFKNQKEIAEAYIDRYSPVDYESRMIDEDFIELGDSAGMKKAEWERWINEEISAEEVGYSDEKVIEDLINKYEQEPTAKGERVAPRAEGEVSERVISDDAYESARKTSTTEELRDYENYRREQLSDEESFRREYEQNARITDGESREEYIRRKYCQGS